MVVNDFLPFCPTDTGTNLLSESDYLAAADRTSGNKPGIASSKLNNRALRQANAIASQMAQFVANSTGTDVVDDSNPTKMLAQFTSALSIYAPIVTSFTSGTASFNVSFYFQIATGSATTGATYTNNTITYTVVGTVSAGTVLRATGNGNPTVSGTLTKASGTGDATITFYAFRRPLYLKGLAIGGGGGGGGGNSGGTAGSAGSDTTFGTTLVVAKGGSAGRQGGGAGEFAGGAGGTGGSLGTTTGIIVDGTDGFPGSPAVAGVTIAGGAGGGGAFFGGGGQGGAGTTGNGGTVNTGGGGGGGSSGSVNISGASGGGGGEGVEFIISAPLSSYTYAVGAGGGHGSGGASSSNGGDGAAGRIVIYQYFQ